MVGTRGPGRTGASHPRRTGASHPYPEGGRSGLATPSDTFEYPLNARRRGVSARSMACFSSSLWIGVSRSSASASLCTRLAPRRPSPCDAPRACFPACLRFFVLPPRFTVLPCPPPLPRCSPRPVELLPFAFFLRSCWNFFVADIMEAIGAARAVGKPRGSASILIASRTREPARARPRPKMT